ncbi:hypothetical protein K505DRAFT_373126 [Melanomma pulvis-pyrius CBS 109.77]|uniref:Mis14-domain-containing protein n=1 Tax=Melanomma pulvis-pyrius CBS 109.77 TaxID=1314802 RepID=A0A6A6XJE6_9PLEO|nr:hypothetical protein K505DRAFT_373126 [Melanomma pulvis-pyrius CBS 109.77]
MSTHRKIELQSPADLTYITALLRTAATQRLNNALPPSPSSTTPPPTPDAYRAKVSSLVDAFVAEVLQGLRTNISINGLDVAPGMDDDDGGDEEAAAEAELIEYEAYDEKLRARVALLVARRDKLVSRISAHRRATAGGAALELSEALGREFEAQDRAWEVMEGGAGVVVEEELGG